MVEPAPGAFITLEGGEGAGKSTQARRLFAALRAHGVDAVLTREPGGAPGAEAIRDLLLSGSLDRWSRLSEALLFAAARSDHLEKTIRPARRRGIWVVCDRFHLSTRAYQGIDEASLMQVRALEAMVLRPGEPDLAIVLDVAETTAARRLQSRGRAPDRMEGRGAAFHAAVRERFRRLAGEPGIVLIDAEGEEDAVFRALWGAVVAHWPVLAPDARLDPAP